MARRNVPSASVESMSPVSAPTGTVNVSIAPVTTTRSALSLVDAFPGVDAHAPGTDGLKRR